MVIPHAMLSLSSLIFHIPRERVAEKPSLSLVECRCLNKNSAFELPFMLVLSWNRNDSFGNA